MSQPLPYGRVWCTCVASVVAEECNYCVMCIVAVELLRNVCILLDDQCGHAKILAWTQLVVHNYIHQTLPWGRGWLTRLSSMLLRSRVEPGYRVQKKEPPVKKWQNANGTGATKRSQLYWRSGRMKLSRRSCSGQHVT